MNKFPERLAKALKKNPRPREEAEAKYTWLTLLLDGYHIYDTGAKIEQAEEEQKRRSKIACCEGCVSCCLRPSAPATELEVMGIWWFIKNKLDEDIKSDLIQRLVDFRTRVECPFLINRNCAVYQLRPLACRILHAFGTPCPDDKMIMEAKGADIWIPSRDVGRKAAMAMLPYYGFSRTQDKVRAFEAGFFTTHSRPLLEINWEGLVHQNPDL